MKLENFERANAISAELKTIKGKLKVWELAEEMEDTVNTIYNSRYYAAHLDHVPFEVVKALSIAGYTNQIKKLEEEFNNL